MSKLYRVLCEECDQETFVTTVDEHITVDFCPCCGRRVEPEHYEEDE
jgi:NMD protein affecting ribosome stability and mRNA decay